jgi:hypothetical protein
MNCSGVMPLRSSVALAVRGLCVPYAAAPVTALVATSVALWLMAGVGLAQIAVFVGYELGYVFFPGWSVYRALARSDGWARQLVFGFAFGYAIQVLAFLFADALDARWIVYVYPLAALPVALLGFSTRAVRRQSVDISVAWATALMAIAALLWLWLAYFAAVPLPWAVPSATYATDLPYHLSLAAEAKHHWPLRAR